MRIPELRSRRLTLRPYEAGDFEAFAALNAEEIVRRRVGGPLSRTEAARLFESFSSGETLPGSEAWAVVRNESREYIGHCWLRLRLGTDSPELGLLVRESAWGRGFGTEIAQALLAYARSRADYRRVVATVDPDHLAAIRVLERAGMRRARVERDEQGDFYVYEFSESVA